MFITHSTHYLFSNWLKMYSEFSKSAPEMSSSYRLYNYHVKDTQGHWLSCHCITTVHALCCLLICMFVCVYKEVIRSTCCCDHFFLIQCRIKQEFGSHSKPISSALNDCEYIEIIYVNCR